MKLRTFTALALLALAAACTSVGPTASETPDANPERSSGGMRSGH